MRFPFFGRERGQNGQKQDSKPARFKTQDLITPELKSLYGGLSPFSLYRGQDGSVYLFENLSPAGLVDAYLEVSPLNTGIKYIANSTASLPIRLMDKKTHEYVYDHPAYKLLANPNKTQQKIRAEYVRDLTSWRVLTGQYYMVLTGNVKREPLELYMLNPQFVDLVPDSTGYIGQINYNTSQSVGGPGRGFQSSGYGLSTTYTYDDTAGTFYNPARDQEVYMSMYFSPNFSAGNLWPTSEIAALYYELNHYMHASQHNLSLLNNGARPSGAFVAKAVNGAPAILSEEAYERLKGEIQSTYMGAVNAGRPLLLEGNLEWESMEFSPRDLDFARLKEKSEEAIYQNLQIPPQLIMASSVSAANMDNLRREFYENRVLPLGDAQCEHLTKFLLPRYGKTESQKYEFVVDRDAIDVLIPVRAERRKVIENSLIMTINEKRGVYNMNPLENGDKIVDPNGRFVAGEGGDLGTPDVNNPTLSGDSVSDAATSRQDSTLPSGAGSPDSVGDTSQPKVTDE